MDDGNIIEIILLNNVTCSSRAIVFVGKLQLKG